MAHGQVAAPWRSRGRRCTPRASSASTTAPDLGVHRRSARGDDSAPPRAGTSRGSRRSRRGTSRPWCSALCFALDTAPSCRRPGRSPARRRRWRSGPRSGRLPRFHDLREDAEGDLLAAPGADAQARRRPQALQQRPLLLVELPLPGTPSAPRPASRSPPRRCTTGRGRGPRGPPPRPTRPGWRPPQAPRRPPGPPQPRGSVEDGLRSWKSRRLGARVDGPDAVAHGRAEPREGAGRGGEAVHEQPRGRQHGLDVDLHASSAVARHRRPNTDAPWRGTSAGSGRARSGAAVRPRGPGAPR